VGLGRAVEDAFDVARDFVESFLELFLGSADDAVVDVGVADFVFHDACEFVHEGLDVARGDDFMRAGAEAVGIDPLEHPGRRTPVARFAGRVVDALEEGDFVQRAGFVELALELGEAAGGVVDGAGAALDCGRGCRDAAAHAEDAEDVGALRFVEFGWSAAGCHGMVPCG
jgi:hypothetical protein